MENLEKMFFYGESCKKLQFNFKWNPVKDEYILWFMISGFFGLMCVGW